MGINKYANVCMKIVRHKHMFFPLNNKNDIIENINDTGTWLFRPHPPRPDSAPRSTRCQQPRPRPSWWSRRRRRRTPFLRTSGCQVTRGLGGAWRKSGRQFKSRPLRSLMPGGGGTHHWENLEPEHRPSLSSLQTGTSHRSH